MIKNKIIFLSLLTIIAINIFSCSHRYLEEEYLYDKVGFAPGSAPDDKRLENINTTPPSYYFRSNYNIPASRYYSNPYEIPTRSYPRQYDSDGYYVVPNAYRNIERQY